jgi:hypothetical protein
MSHAVANRIEPAKSLQPAHAPAPVGKAALWSGRVISTLPALFLLFDAVMKLIKPGFVVEATGGPRLPGKRLVPLGIVLAGCTILYLIPRTAALGAILLTGYLGGAIAAHVRHEDGWFPIVFCVVFGALLWSGLLLRDARLRAVLPWNR